MAAPPETASRAATTWPRFLTVRELAAYLHLNEKTVYALAAEGRLPGTKVTGKWLFPRDLVDQWLLQTSHGGALSDRLLVAAPDDPLLARAFAHLCAQWAGRASLAWVPADTVLGLELLGQRRADAAVVRWGPLAESSVRHPALLTRHAAHTDWVLVRLLEREWGVLLSPRLEGRAEDVPGLIGSAEVRWALPERDDADSRALAELTARFGIEAVGRAGEVPVGGSREAAAALACGDAEVAVGPRSLATEFALDFAPVGWEALDLAVPRAIYFRRLFQQLLEVLASEAGKRWAAMLGGYELGACGRVVWSPPESP